MGKVHLVGAGPGAPDLLTLRGSSAELPRAAGPVVMCVGEVFRGAFAVGAAVAQRPRGTHLASVRVIRSTIDDVFCGLHQAQKARFADGGVFDQIFQPG